MSTSPPSLTPNPCLPALSLPPSVSPTSRNRQGWLRDEARGDEGGGRGSLRRRAEEGGRGLGLSLDQYSHLLPAGPGRTSRSEAHLLADIKPPYLQAILHPTPPGWSILLPSFRPTAGSWPASPLGKPSRFASVEMSRSFRKEENFLFRSKDALTIF